MSDERKSQRVRVIESYTASCSDPLRARAGETLTLGKRDDEFPGWVWCTNARGKSGWTPETYLEIRDNTGTLLRDYDARELTVKENDILNVEIEESGWLRCVTDSGERGWIPKKNTEILNGI